MFEPKTCGRVPIHNLALNRNRHQVPRDRKCSQECKVQLLEQEILVHYDLCEGGQNHLRAQNC